jgi:hypothetical protein
MQSKDNIIKDRLILSPIEEAWKPEPIQGGSYYNHICKKLEGYLEEHGDWVWLHDRITDTKLMATDFQKVSKK